MYEDRLGVPMAWPGGVFGGVGSAAPGMKVSAKASTDGLTAGRAPAMVGKSMGSVSSTITMDLLPVVIPVTLVGRSSESAGASSIVSMWAAENSGDSLGIPCGDDCSGIA